ncbi:hypothetical protein HPP92_012052 [Vanilla planifolia]|uniref:Uncharacterized protein n=1 Tax=Vanilla planifolia TaxID=51239 RepID=A0A835UZ19_VANPL|nr:hypothetical protein HPP92_012052 [Vanilla planifolia]
MKGLEEVTWGRSLSGFGFKKWSLDDMQMGKGNLHKEVKEGDVWATIWVHLDNVYKNSIGHTSFTWCSNKDAWATIQVPYELAKVQVTFVKHGILPLGQGQSSA